MFKIMVGGFIICATLFFAILGVARVYFWRYRRFRRWIYLQNETDEFDGEDDENVFADTENASVELSDLRNLSSEERARLHREKTGSRTAEGGGADIISSVSGRS